MNITRLTLPAMAAGTGELRPALPLEDLMAIEPSAMGRLALHVPSASREKAAIIDRQQSLYPVRGGIAVLPIEGPLEQRGWFFDGYDAIRGRFEAACADPSVRAIVMKINSPGGIAAGCFEAVAAMRRAKESSGKPVYAFADEAAFSAAYALACVADQIFLPQSGGVGSVGVVSCVFDWTKMNEEAGLNIVVITSGEQKADGHPDVALTDDVIARFQQRVDALGKQFAQLVAEGRNMTPEAVLGLQAACLFGKDAVSAGLANGVKSFDDVMKLAVKSAATSTPRAAARTENTNMSMIALAAVVASLGLPSEATEAQALDKIRDNREGRERADAARVAAEGKQSALEARLLQETGAKTIEGAFGVIAAGAEAVTQLKDANAKIAEFAAKAENAERDEILRKADEECKLTPAKKEKLKDKPLAFVKEHVELLEPIPALLNSRTGSTAPASDSAAANIVQPAPDLAGQKWEELKPAQKASLFKENKPLYDALKSDHARRTSAAKAA